MVFGPEYRPLPDLHLSTSEAIDTDPDGAEIICKTFQIRFESRSEISLYPTEN